MKYLEISQLLNMINDSLPKEKIKLIGEVSKPKISNGNVYFSLQDRNGSIKAILWKSKIKHGKEINDGDKIYVKGHLDFYQSKGTISFIITKIIKYNGEGDLHKIYEKHKKYFEKKGYFSKINKLIIPKKITNILILTSKNGRAITDILHIFTKNKSKINYDLINVAVQGKKCPEELCYELSKIEKKYDLVIISRGGGEYKDLFGFCMPELIEAIYNFNQPVLSAIGHKDDTTLIDLVADAVSSTPTDAAQYIIDTNKKYLFNLKTIKRKFNQQLTNIQLDKQHNIKKLRKKLFKYRQNIVSELKEFKNKFNNILYDIPNKFQRKINNLKLLLKKEANFFISFKNNLKNKLKLDIKSYLINLENLKDLLNRKQEIKLYCNNKEIKDPNRLNKKILKNANIILTWNNFKYNVKFTKTELLLNYNK